MNREIKFRAWWKEESKEGKMIYFDEIGYCDEYNLLSFHLADKSREPDGGDYSNLCADFDQFVAVMQYTGIKDKNEKEIYEGDIVKFDIPGNPLGVIEYDDHYEAGGCFRPNSKDDLAIDWWGEKMRWYKLEIIGNIHENPELIK